MQYTQKQPHLFQFLDFEIEIEHLQPADMLFGP